MAKMIIDAPNTCKECMDMGLACGMVHKDFNTARKANCPLNILSEGSIFTKDEVLSILKDLRISMDATATDLQNKIDKVESL